MIKINTIPFHSPQYEEMRNLRILTLIQPLGLTFEETHLHDTQEDLYIVAMREKEKKIVGCCMLTVIDRTSIQLRQMGVLEEYRKKGIGKKLVAYAEQKAASLGFVEIRLHARKKAIPFYERLGYIKEGAPFTEVTLVHFTMKKSIKNRLSSF